MQTIIAIFGSFFEDREFGAVRSAKWPQVEKEFIKNNPTCLVCGKKGSLLNPLNVHHLTPFHKDISLELVNSNLRTLCRQHHFLFGHLMSWASWNSDLDTDSRIWNDKLKNRPK